MGQYYKPMCIETKEFVYSHSYGNGLKLMEHSWVGNDFVGAVEKLISKDGAWHGKHIVWAGDYADPEKDENGEVLQEEYDERMRDINLYDLAEKELKPAMPENFYEQKRVLRYLVNLDKNEFVDIKKVPESNAEWNEGWQIHPLPLLTCEGNGRGGGDFRGDEKDLVGRWARDRVVIQKSKPKNKTELIFDLTER